MKLFLGIDPGLSGAIALVDQSGAFFSVEDMPTVARGNGRVKHQVESSGVAALIRPHLGDIAYGIIEQLGAMPGQGVASMFSLGHSYGVVCAVAETLCVPYELITPAVWKRHAGVPTDKAQALASARRRWPNAPLTRAKDHGRAEALFMALHAISRATGATD